MYPSRALVDGAVGGLLIGWAMSQWLNNPSCTILGMPIRVVYAIGGLTVLFVLLITWMSCKGWEE